MRKSLILAAIAAFGFAAANANAQTFVSTNVTVDTTWGGAANPSPIILEAPIFVKDDATLKILPGTIVRGQPRTGDPATLGFEPGALIVTRTGRIEAVGTANNPVIFTTAATDNDNDGNPDIGTAPFLKPFVAGDTFLDDDPLNAPLAPLAADGTSAVSYWGGLVLLGEAPTNLANNNGAGAYGKGLIEGVLIPGFPPADATYGGLLPHDSSGILQFVSVRHAGDEVTEANELNCISLGGVGDGTVMSHVECYANFDDGFEWFGGTMDADHLITHAIGDDSLDLDQGYNGLIQFAISLQTFFSQDDGTSHGSTDGTERAGEWDGDDKADVNTRLDASDFDVDPTCWPLAAPSVYNWTVVGSVPSNGVPAGTMPAAIGTGVKMRNGYAGRLLNSVIVNYGTGKALDVDGTPGAPEAGCGTETQDYVSPAVKQIAVVSSIVADSAAIAGLNLDATNNGDALCSTEYQGFAFLCNNTLNAGTTLASEGHGYDAHGNASGKLDPSLLPAGLDLTPTAGAQLFGVPPQGTGLDTSADYRGAKSPGAVKWWTGAADGGSEAGPGWNTISNAGWWN